MVNRLDGGNRSDESAKQYKSQVESVIARLRQRETESKGVHEKPPSVYVLLLSRKEGVTVLKKRLSYAVEKYQPVTVRSYLMSFTPLLHISDPRASSFQPPPATAQTNVQA